MRTSARILICLILLAALTYISFSLLRVNSLIAGLAYLLLVLAVAAKWGFLESIVTSIAAMLCLNFFFLPPTLTLTIADPQNWVALSVFLATATTASRLSTRASQRAFEAQTRRAEVERLYALSCSLMMLTRPEEVGAQIANLVARHFEFQGVAFCNSLDGRIDCAGKLLGQLDAPLLREIASHDSSHFLWQHKSGAGAEVFTAAVTLGGKLLGSLRAAGPPISQPAWQAIANLAGITVERLRNQAAASRIEAARQSESLKDLLLDALAHDFVTPLTSVKGAITAVRSEYIHEPDEDDLLAVAEEETDKLNGMVNEVIDMARIDSGHLQIRRRNLSPHDLIQDCLRRMSSLLDRRPTEINLPEDIPAISADPDLAAVALRQLINNAVKYSSPRTKIEISGNQSEGMVVISVRDEGPGVSPDEVDAIFDRYYRGSRIQSSVPGTGMGLSIARDIVAGHGGRIWVKNRPDRGAEFAFTLPIAEPEEGE
ncbi:MAG TPA: ATP-binding protein [Bryobacteraceae bacterium]|nr:ATP-binding protein [Bryobacteraceae bacterium]